MKQLVEVTRSAKKVVSRSSTALSWLRKKRKKKHTKTNLTFGCCFYCSVAQGLHCTGVLCIMICCTFTVGDAARKEYVRDKTCCKKTWVARKQHTLPLSISDELRVRAVSCVSGIADAYEQVFSGVFFFDRGLNKVKKVQNALITLYLPSGSQGISQFFCHQSFMHSLIYWPLLLKNYKCV